MVKVEHYPLETIPIGNIKVRHIVLADEEESEDVIRKQFMNVFSPFTFILTALGVTQVYIKDGEIKKTPIILKCLPITVYITLVVYNVLEKYILKLLNMPDENEFDIVNIIDKCFKLSLAFTIIPTTLLNVVYDGDKCKKLLENLAEVDFYLSFKRADCYKIMKRKRLLLLAFVTIYDIIYVAADQILVNNHNYEDYFQYLLLVASTCVIYEYEVKVMMIAFRVSLLSREIVSRVKYVGCEGIPNNVFGIESSMEFLSKLLTIDDKALEQYLTPEKNKYKLDIPQLMRIYDRLLDSIDLLSDTYGMEILSTVASAFFGFVSLIAVLVKNVKADYAMLLFVWIHQFSCSIICLSLVTEYLYMKLEANRDVINKILTHGKMDPKTKQQMSDFSFVAETRQPKITACNLFTIDLSLILKFCGVLTSYTIVELQVFNP